MARRPETQAMRLTLAIDLGGRLNQNCTNCSAISLLREPYPWLHRFDFYQGNL